MSRNLDDPWGTKCTLGLFCLPRPILKRREAKEEKTDRQNVQREKKESLNRCNI